MSSDDWLYGLQCLDFPDTRYVVYIIGIDFGGRFVPFYVGETSRDVGGRIGDYISGQFTAKADFKVAKAIYYFRPGHKIKVYFKESDKDKKARLAEEREWERKAAKKCPRLLNDYRSRRDNQEEEARRIGAWVKDFLSDLEAGKSPSPDS